MQSDFSRQALTASLLLLTCAACPKRPASGPLASSDAAVALSAVPLAASLYSSANRPLAAGESSVKWLVAVSHEPAAPTAKFQPVELPASWPDGREPTAGKYLV